MPEFKPGDKVLKSHSYHPYTYIALDPTSHGKAIIKDPWGVFHSTNLSELCLAQEHEKLNVQVGRFYEDARGRPWWFYDIATTGSYKFKGLLLDSGDRCTAYFDSRGQTIFTGLYLVRELKLEPTKAQEECFL